MSVVVDPDDAPATSPAGAAEDQPPDDDADDSDNPLGWPDLDEDDLSDALPPLDFLPPLELLRQVSEEESVAAASGSEDLGEEKLSTDDASAGDQLPIEDVWRSTAWTEEVEALQAIFPDDIRATLTSANTNLGCVEVKLTPYCGDLHLYAKVEIDCTFRQTHMYPDAAPNFQLSNAVGLNEAEVFVLENMMRDCIDKTRIGDNPIMYDVISSAREFLAQKATFVTKKEFVHNAEKARERRKAQEEERRKYQLSLVEKSEAVTIQSWPTDGFVLKHLPSMSELVQKLEGAKSNDCKWTVSNVASTFLVSRFKDKVKSLSGHPTVAFHGTKEHNAASICAHGLLVPGVASKKGGTRIRIANGAVYGHGVYTSPYFSTAACYSNGAIFLCLVQLGKANNGEMDYMSASNGSKFDSNTTGNIFVLFNSAQVLPCLLLKYQGGQPRSSFALTAPKLNIAQSIVTFVPGPNTNVKKGKSKKW